jgi:hypothetical protein
MLANQPMDESWHALRGMVPTILIIFLLNKKILVFQSAKDEAHWLKKMEEAALRDYKKKVSYHFCKLRTIRIY